MKISGFILFAFLCLAPAQETEGQRPGEPRLPNGTLQKEAIAKADHEKNIEDAGKLLKLSEDLKSGLEKSEGHVLSIEAIKQTEEIEKLARKIRARMKKY
jgi:hypothetical protein